MKTKTYHQLYLSLLSIGVLLLCSVAQGAWVITTIAGNGNPGAGDDDIPGQFSRINFPTGVCADGAGNVYFADNLNHRVRKVDSLGNITTIAGTGMDGFSGDGGPAVAAQLSFPRDVTIDSNGIIYIADMDNDRIRRIDLNGIITSIAGTGVQGYSGDGFPANIAMINEPTGVDVDVHGDVFIADRWNHRIRKVDMSTGIIDTVAGSGLLGYSGDGGPALQADLRYPRSVAVDQEGRIVIADTINHRIRVVDNNGIIDTVAGTGTLGFSGNGGPALNAKLYEPWGVEVDHQGRIFIADTRNTQLRYIDTNGIIRVCAGSDLAIKGEEDCKPFGFPSPQFLYPYWCTPSPTGPFRSYNISGCTVRCDEGVPGDWNKSFHAPVYEPYGVGVDPYGTIYLADSRNHRIRKIYNDIEPPVITLNGESHIDVEWGTSYTEEGAVSMDAYQGNVNEFMYSIIWRKPFEGERYQVSTINPLLLGEYTAVYGGWDVAENRSALVERTVIVRDTIPPELTLIGQPELTVDSGVPYNDAGATAWDNRDQNITNRIEITNPVDVNTPGNYVIRYEVSDFSGNEAEPVERLVRVRDAVRPIITIIGDPTMVIETHTRYIDDRATAWDNMDGDITDQIITNNPVDTLQTATYRVTYDVTDASGNAAQQKIRYVEVADTTPPEIQLNGDPTVTVSVGDPYVDGGATAVDRYDGNLTDQIHVYNPVDVDEPGTYTIRYNVSDAAGNAADEVTRIVHVFDGENPVITLLGEADTTAQAGRPYNDAGAIAFDNSDGDITHRIRTDNFVNPNRLGAYRVFYNVTDTSGNRAPEVERKVTVADTLPPVITLLGDAEVLVEQNTSYEDDGATALDVFYGDVTDDIVTDNTVDTTTAGLYTVSYDVTDESGNEAETVIRQVRVADSIKPTLDLIGQDFYALECGDPYREFGFDAWDNIDGDISGQVVRTGAGFDTNVPGQYVIRYNVEDSSGNAADEQTRTIMVVDTLPPRLTLDTCEPTVLNCGEEYIEQGAIAIDHCEGDLSDQVIIGGDIVDSSQPGKYVVTYNITDASGNKARQITRSVIVLLCEPPEVDPNFDTLCGSLEDLLAELEILRTALDISHDDFDRDDLEDAITLQLMRHAVCSDEYDSALSDAALEVISLNRYLLRRETHKQTYRPYREVLALLLASNSTLQEKLVDELYDWGIPLDHRYAIINCTTGDCMPAKNVAPEDCPEDIFSGGGDPDQDDVTNTEELENVLDEGYGVVDFLYAAMDPNSDGKETLEPTLSVWPGLDHDFGAVEANSSTDYTFTLTNTGTGLLECSIILSGASAYSIVGENAMHIERGHSAEITIRFQPDSEGEFNGTLQLLGGTNGTVTVQLSGMVLAAEKSDASCGAPPNATTPHSWGDLLLILGIVLSLVWSSWYTRRRGNG